MIAPIHRTAIVLVASGLSRRFGRQDKMLATLGDLPLIEHAAGAIAALHPLARVAVCPANRPAIGERLIGRFVVAINKKPRQGLGHSIAVGAQVALQFKPSAIMICMADMPFVEPWLLEAMTRRFAEGGADILHGGAGDRPHPPTIFGPACYDQLGKLDGDDGAKSLMRSQAYSVGTFNAPRPLLFDVDTRDDLDFARRQLAIRSRCYASRLDEEEQGEVDSAAPAHLRRAIGTRNASSRAAAG